VPDDEAGVQPERETVVPLELFFDLAFVFAFTQVTTLLRSDPTWGGVLRAALLLSILWWAWSAYAWLTNTVDPEEGGVRMAMLAAIAAMLIASLAAPTAFGRDATTFAIAYLRKPGPNFGCQDGRMAKPTHATLASFHIDLTQEEDQRAGLEQIIVPGVRRHPGFVSGTWALDRETSESFAMLTYESRAAAEAMRDNIISNAENQRAVGIELITIRVLEVSASATAAG
jgi:hypothetical protein